MNRYAKRKSSKSKRPKTKLGLPDLDHSKSAVLDILRSPSRSVDIDRRSMNSFSGIALSRACRSTRLWSPVIASSSRIASSLPVRLTDGWRP